MSTTTHPDRVARPAALTGRSAHVVWWLAGATTVGTMVELAVERHWHGWIQLIPWVACTATLAALVAARAASPVVRRTARTVLAALLVVGVVGVVEHVRANVLAAPLDAVVGPTWDQRGLLEQLWLAASGGVGPSPSLAPLITSQAALLGLVATTHARS